MAEITCQECGDVVNVPPSRATQKFCSWDCRTARPRDNYAHQRRSWSCETCGNTFDRRPSDMAKRFCSASCRRKGYTIKVEVTCQHCGLVMHAYPSKVDLGRKKFCSRACAALGRPQVRVSKIGDAAIDAFLKRAPYLILREHRIGRWTVDVALPTENLVIELDGEYWHSLPSMAARDKRKDADLALRGWDVVRVVMRKGETADVIADHMVAAIATTRQRRRSRTPDPVQGHHLRATTS